MTVKRLLLLPVLAGLLSFSLCADEAETPPAEGEQGQAAGTEASPGETAKDAETNTPEFEAKEIPGSELSNFEIYVSKSGDTLMSIAAKYYGDDSQWEKIYGYNKYIKSPSKLLPGTEVIVPLPEKPKPKVKLEATGAKGQIILEQKLRSKEDEKNYMIVPETFKFDGYISGQKLERVMISASDIVYLDIGSKNGVQVADRYAIYRRGKEVVHPETEQVMGNVVEKIGHLEIIGGIQEASCAALIITSFEPISLGDMIKKISK